jgi:hypothetical protein
VQFARATLRTSTAFAQSKVRCVFSLGTGQPEKRGTEHELPWKFKVVNQSSTAAVEFRTQEDGEWSKNWIADRIEPGDTFVMDFGTDKGDCTVRT